MRDFSTFGTNKSIIAFKGKFKSLQHMPNKPHSTGIKLYGMADSEAYMYSFWLYRGKTDTAEESAKPYDVVVNFIKRIPAAQKHIFITDSYYGGFD